MNTLDLSSNLVCKKILGLWFLLVLKVKSSAVLIFKVIFLCQKLTESFWFFFSLKNIKKWAQLSLWHIVMFLILNVLYYFKKWPIFDLKNRKEPKAYNFLYTPFHQVAAYSSLNSAKLSLLSKVTLIYKLHTSVISTPFFLVVEKISIFFFFGSLHLSIFWMRFLKTDQCACILDHSGAKCTVYQGNLLRGIVKLVSLDTNSRVLSTDWVAWSVV